MLIDHPVELFVYQLTNVTVAVGYLYLAFAVLPHVPIRRQQSRIGGTGFFVTGGLIHLDLAATALLHPQMNVGEIMTSIHTLLIFALQSLFIWLFVTGLYMENSQCGTAGRSTDGPALD